MKRADIIAVMEESEGKRIHCIEDNGEEWTGIVDVFESEADNENDETQGASICVKRDDGYNVVVYDSYIKTIEVID